MDRLRGFKVVIGLCAGMAAGSASAETSPFVGRWHWDRAQSTMPPGEPVPKDVTVEISSANPSRLKWSLTVLVSPGQAIMETFDAAPDGSFYPISDDTTASFRVAPGALEATFKDSSGESDSLTCTLSADGTKMTCKGVLNDGDGQTANYVDVYDRM
jgi:hypothetical protein